MDVIRATVQLGLKAHSSIAVSAEGQSHTYLQVLQSALDISSELKTILSRHQPANISAVSNGPSRSTLGAHVEAPPRVGIIAKPSAEFVAGLWATWLCRGIAVPLALSYPEAELLHVLTDADISVVLGTSDYESQLKQASHKASSTFFLLPQVKAIDNLKLANMDELSSLHVLDQARSLAITEGTTPGLIVYTSGTTGKPKGVVHTHSGMNAQVKMLSKAWEYTSDDRFLHCLPLHHVHGLFNGLLAPLCAGAMVEFLPKFSVKGVWKRWMESYPSEGVKGSNATTVFTGVPTMYAYLLQGYKNMDTADQKVAASAAQRLRLMMCGSSALPQPVMTEWEALTSHRLLERYGMTEFVMALSNPYHGQRKAGTVGKPLPGVEVKIVDDDPAVPGTGELCVKSPSLFQEYWRQPEVTKESFLEDGYFKTGDSATADCNGYYTILGRSSVDIMKVGGFKLSALEIEAVLLEHPLIAECAVLGLPDVYYGEVICVVAVLTDEAKVGGNVDPPLTLSQLQSWAKERMAPYKAPSRLVIWDEMPRNALGKVNKKELKKLLTD
ncbi:hypothetical protein GOP47_0011459 [Adiantum capillus-veneris]|uniref:Malonate--CoA ligase n=1 Tax=Adiantum capillus-veneris TaxID=13818 RepID=A0A9D4USZ7_ADICA|nr:hypothetical protein GOP47_0011459 [Adiantum capillus-veneris]